MKNQVLIVVGLIIFVLILAFIVGDYRTNQIKDTIQQNGGDYISSQEVIFDYPFFKTKHEHVYRFEYYYDGEKRIGYVKFGLATDWIFDYQEK